MEEALKELNAEGIRSVFLKYTRKTFNNMPKIDKPRILDLGCGTGMCTLELARLSNGMITGIDINQDALDKLNLKINKLDLSNRVTIYNRSAYNTQFEEEIFDIIWEEGVIHLLDLKKVLKECHRVLKVNGFMISGETKKWAGGALKIFPKFGFKLIKQIPWEKKCWWTAYYSPLEQKINVLRKKYDNLENME